MESNDIYDHSTLRGKFQKVFAWITWKRVIGLLGVGLLIALAGTVIGEEVVQSTSIADKTDFELVNGRFTFVGNETTFPTFPGFSESVLAKATAVTSMILKYVTIIDATSFSGSLRNFTGLVSMTLEQVHITGTFQRVFFPKLTEYKLAEIIPNTTQLDTYQNNVILQSNIFFNTDPGKTWNMSSVCDLGVDILYAVNGIKLVTVARNSSVEGTIELNVPYCNDILANVLGSYATLSLANCIVSKSVIPADLKYLNLYNVTFINGSFSELLKQLIRIEYLYAFLPNTTIDLVDIPNTLTHLSLSGVTIITSDRRLFLSNVTDLSIADSQISDEVYNSFSSVFPALERIAAFGSLTANYKLLQALTTRSIWILMEDFDKIPTTPDDREFERTLLEIGIPQNVTNFIISPAARSSSNNGIPITETQALEYKFNLIGFDSFFTFEAFETELGTRT